MSSGACVYLEDKKNPHAFSLNQINDLSTTNVNVCIINYDRPFRCQRY